MNAQALRDERMNRGFSRRSLAREIDVPEQSLRRLEKGQGVRLHYAKRIADWYGVQVLDLIEAEPAEAAV